MELPEVGDQCSLVDCRQLDFLPFRCEFCQRIFCGIHSTPSKHECEKWTEIITTTTTTTTNNGGEKIGRDCSLQSCSVRELTPVLCPLCALHFCLPHRHPPDHVCTLWSAHEAERRRKAEVKPGPVSLGGVPPPKKRPLKSLKARQMAAKVALMKMKLDSVGDSSIPTSDRVYFRVLTPITRIDDPTPSPPSKSQLHYFSTHWSLGRSVDALSARLSIPNRNNEASARKLRLFRADDGRRLADPGRCWQALIEASEVLSGGTLVLEYVDAKNEAEEVEVASYEGDKT